MTALEDAMQQQMAYIVYHEDRPFCANDFLLFECDGKEYKPNYGTIRNKITEFRKKGIIEVDFRDINAYYTMKGKKFGKKSMTLYHTGDLGINSLSPNHPLYKTLRNMIFDKEAIHNIRLRLEVPDIYNISISIRQFTINPVSKDIETPFWNVDNAQVQIRIHKTNTVSVVVGCTSDPISLDYSDNGIPSLFRILARCEGFLQCLTIDKSISIPDFRNWVITMWHFNRDGLRECSKRDFHTTVEKADHTIERIYTKDFGNGKTRPRWELQEYPNKTVSETINDKTAYF
jgi:hypothetical protein